jgi:hypothetical protein
MVCGAVSEIADINHRLLISARIIANPGAREKGTNRSTTTQLSHTTASKAAVSRDASSPRINTRGSRATPRMMRLRRRNRPSGNQQRSNDQMPRWQKLAATNRQAAVNSGAARLRLFLLRTAPALQGPSLTGSPAALRARARHTVA